MLKWNRCSLSSLKLNGEVGLAWNELKQLQPHFAIDDALKKTVGQEAFQLWKDGENKLKMVYGCCFRQGNVKLFEFLWQILKMAKDEVLREWENKSLSAVKWWLLGFHLAEEWCLNTLLRVQITVHEKVGWSWWKMYFWPIFKQVRNGCMYCTKWAL